MSRDGAIELDFGNGTYKFRLPWGQLVNLQEACDAGPYVILHRIQSGTWRLEDLRETIRYGLIGGGMEPTAALRLVREYVEERPPAENLLNAEAILAAALLGTPDETVGEQKAASQTDQNSTISPTES